MMRPASRATVTCPAGNFLRSNLPTNRMNQNPFQHSLDSSDRTALVDGVQVALSQTLIHLPKKKSWFQKFFTNWPRTKVSMQNRLLKSTCCFNGLMSWKEYRTLEWMWHPPRTGKWLWAEISENQRRIHTETNHSHPQICPNIFPFLNS